MSERLRKAFRGQGKSCAMLGSAFMGRLMPLFGDRLQPTHTVARRLLDWPGDVSAGGQSVPLRVAGALHGLVRDGSDAPLIAAYPPHEVDDETLWAAVDGAMIRHAPRIMTWLDQAPQTNEVRRAGALIPAMWWALSHHRMPVTLSELGASGGLNLSLDQFGIEIDGQAYGPTDSPVHLHPRWSGPVPQSERIAVENRAGVDLNPLDPTDPDGALRLMAFLWPDQPERMALTKGALSLSTTRPDQGDAAGWLEQRLTQPHPGTLHILYHTIAWQYFPPETQARATAAIAEAGARATSDAPLAHIALEAAGDPKGARLTGQVWPAPPGLEGPQVLATADYHGRWVDWCE